MKKNILFVLALTMITASIGNAMSEVPAGLDSSLTRIAFNGDGDLLVSDFSYGRILTFAPDTLDVIGEMDINGRPLGVAWAEGLIYIGNSTTGQVEAYNAAGEEQFVLGNGAYPVEMPQDIAIGNGNVYVVDGSDKVVKIFTTNGIFVGTIPENGYDSGVLANPTAIAVDEINQQIYVSDYGDLGDAATPIEARVQVFSFDGSQLYTIDSGASNKYNFTMPQGLSTRDQGELLVIDSLTGLIFVFDAVRGKLLYEIEVTSSGNGNMKMPLDLVVDRATNEVFVTDNMMASVMAFTE